MSNLVVSRDEGLLHVQINRPEVRNALSAATLEEVRHTFAASADNGELKLAVLQGAGERSFAAGGDLKELASLRTHTEAIAMSEAGRAALDAIRYFPVPVMAALNGDALGGGAELAMACDMRLFSASARIAYVQGRINLSPGWGGGYDLLTRLGPRGISLLCSKAWLDAGQALQLGLADYVAGDDEALDAAVGRVIAPMLEQSPHVMRSYKATAIAVRDGKTRQSVVAQETAQFADNWVHPDHWLAVDKVFNKN